MFTLIENYKKLFMMGVISQLRDSLPVAVDADGDADFDMKDFNKFDEKTQRAIRRVLGTTNMKTLEEGKRFSMKSLIEHGFVVERNATIQASIAARDTHRVAVETAGEGLKGAKLQKAVKYIEGKDQKNMDNLAKWLLGRSATSAAELAQAVYKFQKEHGLTADGKPGRGTVGKLNELIKAGTYTAPKLSARERRQAEREAEEAARRAAEADERAVETFNFTRTLKKGMKGADVAALQRMLTERGYDARYNGKYDGDFGGGTQKALIRYQREVLGQRGDGVMTLNGATMKSLTGTSGRSYPGLSESGRVVVEDLQTIERYLNAYNDTFGERGRLISNKMGLLGIASQVRESDANALARELGISQTEVKKLGRKLGFPTGPNVLPGIKRFAVIAALSLITTGGAAIAIELLGINTGTKLSRGPKTRAILEALGRNGGFDARYREMLLSKSTTVGDIAATFDVLNNEAMIPANLKREIRKVFGRNFLSFIEDMFGGGREFRHAEQLIEAFMKTNDVHKGEAILRQLYDLSVKELREQRAKLAELEARGDYGDDERGGNTTADRIRQTTSRIRKMEKALVGIQRALSKIVNLSDKHDTITGTSRDAERAKLTANYEAMIGGGRRLKSIPKRQLESAGAYSLALPKPPTQAAMRQRLELIKNSKVSGDRYSMMAHIMRGINEHHGISFSVAEFEQAFVNMRKLNAKEQKVIDVIVLSNTGRHLSQRFQGEVKSGNITVMTINGTNIYFRGECSNILTVAHPLDTTIQGARSIPLAIPIGNPFGGSGADVGTNPIIDDPIPLDDVVTGTVPTL